MITYNLTEETIGRLFSQVRSQVGTITLANLEQYCLQKYGATFIMYNTGNPPEPGQEWGTVTFTEPEKLTWFLLNL